MPTGFKIHPELAALVPPLLPDERLLLEESLEIDGCRESLLVADIDGEGCLLDGHTRREICESRGIPYEVRLVPNVKSMDDAQIWVLRNQVGRRNVGPDAMSYLRGKLYAALKKQGARTDLVTSGQTGQKSAAEEVATRYKVSERTARRNATYAANLDRLPTELRQAFFGRQIAGLTRGDISKLAEQEDIQALANAMLSSKQASSLPWKRDKEAVEPLPMASSIPTSFDSSSSIETTRDGKVEAELPGESTGNDYFAEDSADLKRAHTHLKDAAELVRGVGGAEGAWDKMGVEADLRNPYGAIVHKINACAADLDDLLLVERCPECGGVDVEPECACGGTGGYNKAGIAASSGDDSELEAVERTTMHPLSLAEPPSRPSSPLLAPIAIGNGLPRIA